MLTHYFIHFLGLFKFIVIPALFFSPFVFSQAWTGHVSNDWNDQANWSSWPLDNDDITIDFNAYSLNGHHPQIFSNSVFIPANIVVQNGAQLTIAADLTVEEDFEILGSGTLVTINAGNISVGAGDEGRIAVDLGGSLIVNSGNLTAGERLISGEDATITINGGFVTTGERLLLELGGRIIQNAGIIQVGEVLALADGNANASCYFEKHGGALTVNGEMALENETGSFEPTFFMDGGTFNMNGDITWFGEAPGSGRPRMIIGGGLFVLDGNIGNQQFSTVNADVEIRDSATVYFEGTTVALFAADSLKQYNNDALHVNSCVILNDGAIHSLNSRITNSGTSQVSGVGITTLSSLHILTGSLFSNVAEFGISFTGDLKNDGTMQNGTSQVAFKGAALQQISGMQPVTFFDLLIDQQTAEGIQFFNDISVTHQLELVSGVLIAQNESAVRISDNAMASEGNPVSFVAGPVTKNGNDAFVFPVGDHDRWMRFEISAPASAAAQVTVEYVDEPFDNFLSVNPPLTAVSPFEYWSVNAINAGPLEFKMHWEDALSSGITSCADLAIAGWDGNSWNNVLSTPVGSCTGSGSGFLLSSEPNTLMSYYTFGFFGDITTQQLQLCKGDSVLVGDDYYSLDGNYVNTSGSTTILTHIDLIGPAVHEQTITLCFGDSVLVGSNYYSLPGFYEDTLVAFNTCDSIVKTQVNVLAPVDLTIEVSQTTIAVNPIYDGYQWMSCDNGLIVAHENDATFSPDADGSYAAIIFNGSCPDTTECVTIAGLGFEEMLKDEVLFFPNPTTGEIQFTLADGITALIELQDYSGKMIYSDYVSGNERLNLSGHLAAGVYLITLTTADGLKTSHRLVITQ